MHCTVEANDLADAVIDCAGGGEDAEGWVPVSQLVIRDVTHVSADLTGIEPGVQRVPDDLAA